MPLTAGTKLGPYEILAPIGAGGMGEVHRARDPRLDRDVAIKVSAEQFSERFEREARAIAALNHPNICQIYDVGPNYLVMELIEGSALKGPLPADLALKYAGQICDALEAAHRKGITHRDLKPANILVTKAGVKLLDFGLAKMGSAAKPLDDATVTMALTGKNEIVGTLYYMSPEQLQGQADGREPDARSDIFSFGLVLYEMLTGRRAMEGSSPASVIAAIMERPAPSIAGVAPAALDRVLKRCLEKDPENRWQNALDVKAALDLAASVVAEVPIARATSSSKGLWGATAALAVAAVGFVGVRYANTEPVVERQAVRFQIPVQPSTGLRPLGAISPDGLSLAYFDVLQDGRLALKIRSMSSGASTEYPAAEMAQPTHLFWSPDSKTIYFGSRRFLKRMDAGRGTVQQICDCSSDSGAVNQDGVILLGSTPARHEIIQVSPRGEVATVRQGVGVDALPGSPYFLPDGRRYLFVEQGGLFLASLDRKQEPARRVADARGRFAFVPGLGGTYLLFHQPGRLEAIPFDSQKGETTGSLMTLPLAGTSEGLATPSASRTGTLLRLLDVESQQNAIWFDRQGKHVGEVGTLEGYVGVDLSPTAGMVAIVDKLSGLRIRDLSRGTVTRLAPQIQAEGSAIWSPDDASVAFAARDKNRVQRLYRADTNNTRPETMILDEPGLHWPNDWSRDGKYLLYGFDDGKTFRDLWALPMDQPGAKPFQYTHGTSLIKQGQFSPDGRFVAYTSDESGQYEVYVQPFPDASKGKWVVSKGGGVEPGWSRDGRELLFFSGQKMTVVDVRTNGEAFTASAPRELFSAPVTVGYSNDSHRWQLSPDGKRFLLLIPSAGSAAYLDVVINWELLLKQ